MVRIILFALLALAAWKGYEKYQSRHSTPDVQEILSEFGGDANPLRRGSGIDLNENFRCDGRTHCSQMTSCEEATFFLRNCPGTKMDGNNDGVPCEQQWCR